MTGTQARHRTGCPYGKRVCFRATPYRVNVHGGAPEVAVKVCDAHLAAAVATMLAATPPGATVTVREVTGEGAGS